MIDKTILDNARNIDLIDFLERYKGFHFRHLSGEYRCTEHTSLAVKSNRLSWYWHSKGIGGYGAIDFLMKIEGYDFKGALAVLADEPTTVPPPLPTADIQRDFILPEKDKSNRRAYAYLTLTRGLDSNIVKELFQKEYIYEDTKGNAVFVGFDEYGKPKYATLRGTYTDKPFRMDCVGSDKRYILICAFSSPVSSTLFSPIGILYCTFSYSLAQSVLLTWPFSVSVRGQKKSMALRHALQFLCYHFQCFCNCNGIYLSYLPLQLFPVPEYIH